jgi:hypothetical protein
VNADLAVAKSLLRLAELVDIEAQGRRRCFAGRSASQARDQLLGCALHRDTPAARNERLCFVDLFVLRTLQLECEESQGF